MSELSEEIDITISKSSFEFSYTYIGELQIAKKRYFKSLLKTQSQPQMVKSWHNSYQCVLQDNKEFGLFNCIDIIQNKNI